MAFNSPLGSITALSLASSSPSLPVLATVAGIIVTVTAAAYTYHLFKEYEVKKHREEIEAINRLHHKHLEKILIPGYNEIQGFPKIFKLTEKADSSEAESMHMTDDEIEDIGKTLPHGTDIALAPYRESISNAISKLKEYYFSRSDHKDVTSGVLSYLLYILDNKCLKFEGYDYDIAYLKAITAFIIDYASQMHREKTQHFSRLNIVYGYLEKARRDLQIHKESLSLEEIVGELRDACVHESKLLMTNFVKTIVPDKYWNIVNTAALDEVAEGILRRKYIDNEIHGLVLKSDSEILIANSDFKNWITSLAKYYLDTLNPATLVKVTNVKSPEEMFNFPNLERRNILIKQGKANTANENHELQLIENEIDAIRAVFNHNQNFISTKVDLENRGSVPVFIPITDPNEVVERSKVLVNFATLIHQIISLQYLTAHLMTSIKQLGEIYVRNPVHFYRIFSTLYELCNQVNESIDLLRKNFSDIAAANNNAMRLSDQHFLPDQINAILDSTYATTSKLGKNVREYRDKVAKNLDPTETSLQSVKQEMFEISSLMISIYNIKLELPPAKKIIVNQVKPIFVPSVNPKATLAAPPVTAVNLNLQNNVEKQPAKLTLEESAVLNNRNETIDSLAVEINQRIAEISEEEKPPVNDSKNVSKFNDEIKSYYELRDQLTDMRNKANELINEKNKNALRQEKAKNVANLVTSLYKLSRTFLLLDRQSRLDKADEFADDITQQLSSPHNVFIDYPKNAQTKETALLSTWSLFSTDTRKKLKNLSTGSRAVAAHLHAAPRWGMRQS